MPRSYQTNPAPAVQVQVVPMAHLRALAEVWRLYLDAAALRTYQDTVSRDIAQRGDAMVVSCLRDLERVLNNATPAAREEIPG